MNDIIIGNNRNTVRLVQDIFLIHSIIISKTIYSINNNIFPYVPSNRSENSAVYIYATNIAKAEKQLNTLLTFLNKINKLFNNSFNIYTNTINDNNPYTTTRYEIFTTLKEEINPEEIYALYKLYNFPKNIPIE